MARRQISLEQVARVSALHRRAARAGEPFELATDIRDAATRGRLATAAAGGSPARTRSASITISTSITCSDSKGEFTVAKDQYVRLNTGWFSDRTACYLAGGRPVITQETGFTDLYGNAGSSPSARSTRSPRPCARSTPTTPPTAAPRTKSPAKLSRRKRSARRFSSAPGFNTGRPVIRSSGCELEGIALSMPRRWPGLQDTLTLPRAEATERFPPARNVLIGRLAPIEAAIIFLPSACMFLQAAIRLRRGEIGFLQLDVRLRRASIIYLHAAIRLLQAVNVFLASVIIFLEAAIIFLQSAIRFQQAANMFLLAVFGWLDIPSRHE